jgi:mono/diheme cytochrome c family protein
MQTNRETQCTLSWRGRNMWLLSAPVILLIAGTSPALGKSKPEQAIVTTSNVEAIVIPRVNTDRGRKLFVTKNCVLCHSVNNVGGQGAPALDAPEHQTQIDLMGFVARMWRGAPAMTELQSKELGYVIQLEGKEIADLAAFLSDPGSQRSFSIREIPKSKRGSFIDKPYWETDTWPEDIGISRAP